MTNGNSFSEFLQLNPVGCVPVLVDDHVVLYDSFAIIMVTPLFHFSKSCVPCYLVSLQIRITLFSLHMHAVFGR